MPRIGRPTGWLPLMKAADRLRINPTDLEELARDGLVATTRPRRNGRLLYRVVPSEMSPEGLTWLQAAQDRWLAFGRQYDLDMEAGRRAKDLSHTLDVQARRATRMWRRFHTRIERKDGEFDLWEGVERLGVVAEALREAADRARRAFAFPEVLGFEPEDA